MNDYNIFKVLKLERKETIHSAMIAAIVAHDKKCWNHFFDMLEKGKAKGFNIEALRKSIIYDDDNDHKWIDTENVLEKLNKKAGDNDWGRADIWIGTNKRKDEEGEKYRLIIENKIDADFQYRQLRGYFRYLNEKPRVFAGLFVLCVNNDEAFRKKAETAAEKFNNETTPTIKDISTNYAIITYKDILNWLEEVIKETEEGDFKTAVKQYKEIIKGFYPETKE